MSSSSHRRLLVRAAAGFGLAALVLLAAARHPDLRETLVQAAANLFGFVTTPFILEATVGLLGLVIVMTYNQWRINKEGDGWVILPEDDPAPSSPPVESATAKITPSVSVHREAPEQPPSGA